MPLKPFEPTLCIRYKYYSLHKEKSPTVKLAALRSAEIFFNRHIVRCLHSCTPQRLFTWIVSVRSLPSSSSPYQRTNNSKSHPIDSTREKQAFDKKKSLCSRLRHGPFSLTREIIPNTSLYDHLLIYNTESFLCSCPMQNGYICTHNKESHCDK